MKDSVADINNENSIVVAVTGLEKINSISIRPEHTENILRSSPAFTECENVVETEEENFDSGYSWVIVCASFINFFIFGTMRIGFSILYVEISEYFGSSKGVTGWIGSLYVASGNIFGEKCHN